MKKLFILFLGFILASCLDERTQDLSSVDEKIHFYFKRIEDGMPITGDENLILRCTNSIAGGHCESICISEYLPQHQRFTFAMSNYEANGKCFVYIFGFNLQDGSLPSVRYYVGDYSTRVINGASQGYCSGLDLNSANFEGGWQFGDDTQNEYLNLYSSDNSLSKSLILRANQGDIFTYFDDNFLDEVTIQTRQGYECRKDSELTNQLLEDLTI